MDSLRLGMAVDSPYALPAFAIGQELAYLVGHLAFDLGDVAARVLRGLIRLVSFFLGVSDTVGDAAFRRGRGPYPSCS